MKKTLGIIGLGIFLLSGCVHPLAWHQTLPSESRFTLVMAEEAVLDHETGLVWERTLSTEAQTWIQAKFTCASKTVGGRQGWRLPSFPELASLLAPAVPGFPKLPNGHPFNNVESVGYWSSTSFIPFPPASEEDAWMVFMSGNVSTNLKLDLGNVWCVRSALPTLPEY